jgi:exopolysaccharide biosynthesis WecB/TagA/CpsF family protein
VNEIDVLGITLHDLTREELFRDLHRGAVMPVNVDVIMKARRQADVRDVLHRAEFRTCDSQIVLLAARFLGTPFRERLSGSDLLGDFCAYHRNRPDIRVFLLGAGPGVALEAARRINARIGRGIVVGTHSPSYGFESKPEECAQIVDMIRRSDATVLAVGLGAPKQERFIDRFRAALPQVNIFFAVGATLDFEAGNVPRAPKWMSNVGLEWLYRLVCEPRRLWRRYLVENPPFLMLVLKQRISRGGGVPPALGMTRNAD